MARLGSLARIQLELLLPRLKQSGYSIDSDATPKYNCIAWAASDERVWWWPTEKGYWPSGVPREVTIPGFILMFESLGYVRCDDGEQEAGFEKVAVFASAGEPTHAARQLQSGAWTSKVGRLEDITHSKPEAVAGADYGEPAAFLKRSFR